MRDRGEEKGERGRGRKGARNGARERKRERNKGEKGERGEKGGEQMKRGRIESNLSMYQQDLDKVCAICVKLMLKIDM